jgi:hypothetical protein
VTLHRPFFLVLSVGKVVPALTSRCAETYLSIADAKQLVTLGFILVPAGAVRPAGVRTRSVPVVDG